MDCSGGTLAADLRMRWVRTVRTDFFYAEAASAAIVSEKRHGACTAQKRKRY